MLAATDRLKSVRFSGRKFAGPLSVVRSGRSGLLADDDQSGHQERVRRRRQSGRVEGTIGFSTSTIERALRASRGEHAGNRRRSQWRRIRRPGQAIDSLGFSRLLVCGNPIRADGRFAELCDAGDRDALDRRPPGVSCRHFNVPSTASPHADLDRSPWGMADRTWLEAVGRDPGKGFAVVPLACPGDPSQTQSRHTHRQEWLNLGLLGETAEAVTWLRGGAPLGKVVLCSDIGEGCGKSMSVIIVRDNVGILEINADAFESMIQTAI